jgi:hypothetical protein
MVVRENSLPFMMKGMPDVSEIALQNAKAAWLAQEVTSDKSD